MPQYHACHRLAIKGEIYQRDEIIDPKDLDKKTLGQLLLGNAVYKRPEQKSQPGKANTKTKAVRSIKK